MSDWDSEAAAAYTRPRDTDAEAFVLGSVMDDPDLIDQLTEDGFHPADFHDPLAAWIWQAVDELRVEMTGPIGFAALGGRLRAWHAAKRMPLAPPEPVRLAQLGSMATPSAGFYADRVSQIAVQNRLIDAGMRAVQLGRSEAFDRATDLAEVQTALDRVVRDDAAAKPVLLGELTAGVLERAVTPRSRETAVPTGFADLDGLTGGWRPGQLIVVGARPGCGKTTLGLGFARAAAIGAGLPALMVSMEMGREELGEIIHAAEARVALHRIRQGLADEGDMRLLRQTRERIDAAPLRIDDTSSVSLAHLRHQVRTLQRTEGLRLLIVDYLQLMQAPRAESRQVAVAALARGLKVMAGEFQIPIIALSQLNRASEQRSDKRPTPADLRESGAVEQDSDIVILLHREDLYDRASPRAGETDVIVAKHRGGSPASITVAAQLHYGRFVDMASEPYNPFAHREGAGS